MAQARVFAIPMGLNDNTSTFNMSRKLNGAPSGRSSAIQARSSGVSMFNTSNEIPTQYLAMKHSPGVQSQDVEILRCHRAWLVALCIATLPLILLSFFGLLCSSLRQGPQLALNILFLYRDNKYLPDGSISSACDAATRARAMRGWRLKIVDVHPDVEVGHLAIAAIGLKDTTGSIKRERLYT